MAQLQQTLTHAFLRLLKPMARILLRQGGSYAEFSELAKLAFVDVAENEFKIEGRKQNASRISVVTGLHRKDVTKIREKLKNDNLDIDQLGRSARVIAGWRHNEIYRDDFGKVKALPLDGDVSFSSLVKLYSGDMSVRAILDELTLSGSVRENSLGEIELIKDTFIPTEANEQLLRILGISTSDFLNTIDYNLNRKVSENSRLQLVVDYKNVAQTEIEDFKRFSEAESRELIKKIGLRLREHCSGDENVDTKRIGFGIYYFENEIEEIKGASDE
jgi:hypothetical protein